MHSKSYISFIRIGQEGFFPPAAAQMFLLDRDSQDFCPLSLALHFAAIKENPVSADRHSGIKKDQELENYCELRADLCATAEQCALVCVVFFFLIVRSRKQKSPPEEKKNACQANSQDESDLTLFFFFFFLRLSAIWGFHLQTETASLLAQPCTFALECQGYIILKLSGTCGIWSLRAKYNTLLRWLGSLNGGENIVFCSKKSQQGTCQL